MTITVHLNPREAEFMRKYMDRMEMTGEQVLKQAFRTYDLVSYRVSQGQTMRFTDAKGKLIEEPVYGCMGDE